MAINFAAASTAGLNNPGTEIITLVKDGGGNFINPPSYDKMREYLRSGEVPMLFVTTEGGETGSLYQLVEYSETENKIRFSNSTNAIEFGAGAAAPVVSDVGGGGGSVLLDNLTLIETINVAEETQYIYRAIDYSLYKYICFSIDPAQDGQHTVYVGFINSGGTSYTLNGGKLYNTATGLVFPLSKRSVFFSWNTGKGQTWQVSNDNSNAEGVAFLTYDIEGLRLYNNDKWQAGDVINIYGEARA